MCLGIEQRSVAKTGVTPIAWSVGEVLDIESLHQSSRGGGIAGESPRASSGRYLLEQR